MIGDLRWAYAVASGATRLIATPSTQELHQPEPGVRAVQALQDRCPDRVIDMRDRSPSTAIKVRRIFSRPVDHD
jgi:hypothetical protein